MSAPRDLAVPKDQASLPHLQMRQLRPGEVTPLAQGHKAQVAEPILKPHASQPQTKNSTPSLTSNNYGSAGTQILVFPGALPEQKQGFLLKDSQPS